MGKGNLSVTHIQAAADSGSQIPMSPAAATQFVEEVGTECHGLTVNVSLRAREGGRGDDRYRSTRARLRFAGLAGKVST